MYAIRSYYDSSDLKIQGVQANPLVSAFMPESANSVQGGLDLSASIKGQGTTMAGIRRHLSGQGDFLFKDGQLSGTALAKGLSDFLAVPELRDLNVKESRGSFTIQNGKVILQSSFTGKDARLNPNRITSYNVCYTKLLRLFFVFRIQ